MRMLLLACAAATLFVSCNKMSNKATTVVKDCTGTYLRYDGRDYHVCNTETTEQFADNTPVKATFKRIKECNGRAQKETVCMLLRANEGWITVEKITPR